MNDEQQLRAPDAYQLLDQLDDRLESVQALCGLLGDVASLVKPGKQLNTVTVDALCSTFQWIERELIAARDKDCGAIRTAVSAIDASPQSAGGTRKDDRTIVASIAQLMKDAEALNATGRKGVLRAVRDAAKQSSAFADARDEPDRSASSSGGADAT